MTIEQAIDYVYASYMKAEPHLDYAADDGKKRNPDFSAEILRRRAGIPAVLVTGSKGKGSVAKMIAEVMGAHRKVGLMTSPHILRFNERIQVQGVPVSDETLVDAIEAVKPEFDKVQAGLQGAEYISPMGIQAAVALDIFAKEGAELAVMECGKGVEYDDVKHVSHGFAVINRIFLEHTRELGATLEEIARNKSAIITEGMEAVFTAEQEPVVMKVLRRRAEACGVPLYQYGRDFWCEHVTYTSRGMCFDVVTRRHRYVDVRVPLLGIHQAENCALALAFCEAYEGGLEEGRVRQALGNLEWPGRLEVLMSNPLMLLDACINEASCANVLDALKALGQECVTTIIGIPSDKDYRGVAAAMAGISGRMILTGSSNPHYRFGSEQAEELGKCGIQAEWAPGIQEALELARMTPDAPICILGTTSLISDVKALAARPMPL